MINYQAKRLMKIYDWVRKNGYAEIWTPAKKNRSISRTIAVSYLEAAIGGFRKEE